MNDRVGKVSRRYLKSVVRGAYDIQDLRIRTGGRIVANFKAKLGQEPSKGEDVMDAEGKKILQNIRARFKSITEGIAAFPKRADFKGDELISEFTELCLVAQFEDLTKSEAQHFKRLESVLQDVPIYTEYLSGIRGIAAAMGGVIASGFDITKAKYASSLWRYAGMDIGPDGKGRSKRKEHLIDVVYTDKHGKEAVRKGITYNPFVKDKLLGVLGGSFLRCGNEKFVKIYGDYKHRMENHKVYGIHNDGKKDEEGKLITCKGRRHKQANRYMVKMFLKELYVAWRTLEGLEVFPPYEEDKLGMKHTPPPADRDHDAKDNQ